MNDDNEIDDCDPKPVLRDDSGGVIRVGGLPWPEAYGHIP
jgi:hypothetical protein